MYRRTRQRQSDPYETGKSSFSSGSPSPISSRRMVKEAIDESLGAVRFNAHDAKRVVHAARTGKKTAARKNKRRLFMPDLVFSFALVMMIAVPLSLYTIKARPSITSVVVSPGQTTALPAETSAPDSMLPAAAEIVPENTAIVSAAADGLVSESAAIQAARSCFEAHCDTSIFTFDEYRIQVSLVSGESSQYTLTLESIYGNGCSFTVVVSAVSGEVLQYSAPRLATVPSFIDSASPEVSAWYEQYGAQLFTWPQDAQAEFSRRYQGGTIRAALEGEISYEQAISAVSAPIFSKSPGLFTAFYPVLYSERASSSGRAYYAVYCYAEEVTDALPEGEPMIVSFDAETGDILSIEGNPLEASLTFDKIKR